jgi:rhodanese-related sulfurtransferase
MKTWLGFFLGLATFWSCSLNGQSGTTVSPKEFQTLLQEGSYQLLDVRTAEEFKGGFIKGALQADWLNSKEFADRTSHLDKAKPVYIYCASGVRSADAAKVLRKKGYQVTEMSGGLNAWKKQSLPLEQQVPVSQMSAAAYEELIHSADVVLVDAGASWCPPCRKMEPVLKQLQQDLPNQFKLAAIDAGVHTELMKQLKVDALPHFFVYKKGQLVWQQQGIVSLEELKAKIR